MWEIYDALIEQVPDDLLVEDCLVGLHWILVRSLGTGMAMTPLEGETRLARAGRISGMPVKTLARGIKSWNNMEAALGLAAINSVLNAPGVVHAQFGGDPGTSTGQNVFEQMLPELRGQRVGVIGHFRGLEPLAAACELHILERRPQAGDLPDPACEYILPTCDTVFITGTTLINKTLPRLLQLSHNAHVVLTGPSVPMTPLLYEHGADTLAGLVVDDDARVFQMMKEGGHHEFFDCGSHMVVARQGVAAAGGHS